MITGIYREDPGPNRNPGTQMTSTQVPGLWVCYTGTLPSVAEIRAIIPAVPPTIAEANRTSAVAAASGTDAVSVRQRATERQMFVRLKQLFDAHNALVQAVALSAAQRTANTLPVPTRATEKAAIVALINADDPAA